MQLYVYLLIVIFVVLITGMINTREKYTDLWDAKKIENDMKSQVSGLFNGIKSFLEGAVTVLSPKIPGKKPCPNGMRDDGTSCWSDTYTRGAGRGAPMNPCPPGSNDVWGTCWYPGSGGDCTGGGCNSRWDNCANRGTKGQCMGGVKTHCEPIRCKPIVAARVAKNIGDRGYSCNADEDLDGVRCYPKCRPGYEPVGCCLCQPHGGPGIKVTAFDRYECPPPGNPGYGKLVGALCYKSDPPAAPPPAAARPPAAAPPPPFRGPTMPKMSGFPPKLSCPQGKTLRNMLCW
jgi:hypothetical protein